MATGIYEIRNTINGNTYVGSAINIKRRWIDHRSTLRGETHSNNHLQNAWNKYGGESFVFRVLFYCDKDLMFIFEQRAMDIIRPEYNILPVAGSPLGWNHSDETKAKISAANKGKPSWNLGRTTPPETRAKISAVKKGRSAPWIKGKQWSPARRAAEDVIAGKPRAHRGKPWSVARRAAQEARANIPTVRKGKPWSDICRAAFEARRALAND